MIRLWLGQRIEYLDAGPTSSWRRRAGESLHIRSPGGAVGPFTRSGGAAARTEPGSISDEPRAAGRILVGMHACVCIMHDTEGAAALTVHTPGFVFMQTVGHSAR